MTTSSSSRPATSMAELMALHGKDIKPLKKGEEVTGVITVLSSQEILVRIDNKTDVLLMEKDRRLHKQLTNLLHVGETVKGIVLYPESDSGYPMITIRKFMEEKIWDVLEKAQKSQEKLPVTVVDVTKGGLLVDADNGAQGFLPNSHLAKGQRVDELVGQKIQASIVELNRAARKVVFSQKENLSSDDFQKLATLFKAGTKVTGAVSGITQFGIFVTLSYEKSKGEETSVDGLVHISEVSWEKVADLSELFHVGETVDAVVIGTDPRSKRIDLSIKKLSSDPFQKVAEAFPIEKKVSGIIGDMNETGLEIDLGEIDGIMVEGFIKKDKIPAATTYEKGQKIQATVVAIDTRKRKVMLTPVLMEKPLMYR